MSALARLFVFCLLVIVSCAPQEAGSPWKKRTGGYYYRLLAFENMERVSDGIAYAWLDLSFATIEDSVFWDSRSNFYDAFFLKMSANSDDLLRRELRNAAEADSFCLLIEPSRFFNERYGNSMVPLFCAGDSAVKLYCRVKRFLGGEDLADLTPSLEKKEQATIAAFFSDTVAQKKARHKSGLYWVMRPQGEGAAVRKGERVTVSYRGYFLNGRVVDEGERALRFSYGDPGQLIPGLNIVMEDLNAGQNAKIIIPSPLAYGSYGSSTGIVPPFTPLLYEISVQKGK